MDATSLTGLSPVVGPYSSHLDLMSSISVFGVIWPNETCEVSCTVRELGLILEESLYLDILLHE